MIRNKRHLSNKFIYVCLFIIAFGTAFSSTFNPLNFRRMHVDSSVYITISQGITRGYLPYRDFIDNKGPLAYFLNVPGLLLGGFIGIWITEIILLFVTAVFAQKTALFFGTRNKALVATTFTFVALQPFFIVNAGTEEYSLPFLMISLYIFTKYYFSPKQKVSFCELVVLGICFACAIMIRLNMFPLWAGFCTVILIESIKNHHFALLGKYVFGFCLGIIIVFIPIFFYLKENGIIEDFFIQVIFNGAARGFSASGIKDIMKSFYRAIRIGYSFLPFFLGVFWIIINFKKNSFVFYIGYTFSYFMMVLFFPVSGSGDPHYNLVLVPYFVPSFIFLAEIIYNVFSQRYAKNISSVFVVVFFCLVFSENLLIFFDDSIERFYGKDKSGTLLINAGKMIDENTKPGNKIISLGYNAYIYSVTERTSVSKYFYQGFWLRSIPNAREDFLFDVLTGKPSVIAIFNDIDGIGEIDDYWHTPILELMEKEYRLLSDENGFNLYILKDN